MFFLLMSKTLPPIATESPDNAYGKFLSNTGYSCIAYQLDNYPQGLQTTRGEPLNDIYPLQTTDIEMHMIGMIDIIRAKAEYGYNAKSVDLDYKMIGEMYDTILDNRTQEYYLECREKLYSHVKERVNDTQAVEDLLSTI